MSNAESDSLPGTARLIKATLIALLVAGVLLITTVLPAEYGIDPTGIGTKLGLTVLAEAPTAVAQAAPQAGKHTQKKMPAKAEADSAMELRNAAEARKAHAAFGASDKQSFAAEAHAPVMPVQSAKQESHSLELAPGKGAEVKTLLKAGQGLIYHWTADGDVAVDMHGERTGVKAAWTSYSVEAAQRAASGAFVAPFDGSHGWYWENRGKTTVRLKIEVSGFQEALYQP
jgi:hypothetical protein